MRWLERAAIVFAAVALMSVAFAQAQPYGATNLTVVNSTRYNVSGGTPPFVNAQAGNVTELNINATTVTTSWQGFYGNVTGRIILADSQGNNFYDWNLSTPSGEVYASRSNAVTWATINCTNSTQRTQEETALGQAGTDPDSITNTYTVTSHPTFLTGSRNMTTCFSTKAYNETEAQGPGFWQVLLSDEGNNTVYTTILESSGRTGFNNRPWQFELLVGENGKTGNDTILTPYYFYVEIQ